MEKITQNTGFEVAIIGIACRFPGARNWREYWNNLQEGKEAVVFLSDEELLKRGISKARIDNKNYVKISSELSDKDCFDAQFFDYSREEAYLMNPQSRIFHECVWEALEDAGYNPDTYPDTIGLYACAGEDLNWRVYSNVMNQDQKVHDFTLKQINNKDFMPTLISYKLNLRGPSVLTQTACSSSLVAIHTAARALLLGEASMALAGGISVLTDISKGHIYEDGSILTKDGHCRSFDKDATGTFSGEGAGVVVLKRLKDALNDKDNIYAVIKGSAANNDGKRKLGYTAPSVEGQYECIAMAQKFSKVSPQSIGYIEAHGTATRLGDAIEIEALNKVFHNKKDSVCELGTVKTNIGHLDTAAGVAGLIKAALSLKFRKIPPTLHFKEPNGEINFSAGPLRVTDQLKTWEPEGNTPLRAGVSSFGIGGTNAHMILEEPPEISEKESSSGLWFLPLSAKTENSLKRYIEELRHFLTGQDVIHPANLSYTFFTGRKHFDYRKCFVFESKHDLIDTLEAFTREGKVVKRLEQGSAIVFLFSGAGSQYVNMGRDLYEKEPLFRQEMDKGFDLLQKMTGYNYREIVYPVASPDDQAINRMLHTQPMIFLFAYSLTQLLGSHGITPDHMIGHSIGEYVAACVSGVFSYEDALRLVVKRGELLDSLEAGAMISASVGEQEALNYISPGISVAAINGPEQVVFSGDEASVELLTGKLDEAGISWVKLFASRAGHSPMVDGILQRYKEELMQVRFNAPQKQFLSNLTGNFITDAECRSVDYWLSHMRETVRFSQGVSNLLKPGGRKIFIEIGGGHSLTSLLKQQKEKQSDIFSITTVRHPKENKNDVCHFRESIGQLWSYGLPVNWNFPENTAEARRISLPAYCFERTKYPTEVDAYGMLEGLHNSQKLNINEWFYRIFWKQSVWLPGNTNDPGTMLAFGDEQGLQEHLKRKAMEESREFVLVIPGACYEKTGPFFYRINPEEESDYEELFIDLKLSGISVSTIFHLWTLGTKDHVEKKNRSRLYQKLGYDSLLKIARSFASVFNSSVHIDVISDQLYKTATGDSIHPAKSIQLGAVKVIPLEFENIGCRAIDIGTGSKDTLAALWKEIKYRDSNKEVALRDKNRYVKDFEKIDFELPEEPDVFRANGTYLITGAGGGMGQLFATFLAKQWKAKLVLIGRSPIQPAFLNELEKTGSEYKYIQSDVTDKTKILTGIEEAEKEFGPVNGVIHAAGIADHAGVILRRTIEDDEKIFAAKVSGTEILGEIFENRPLDFFVNCSSQNASLSHFAQSGYAAANIYLDAFAESGSPGYPRVSIEWGILKEIGIAMNFLDYLSDRQRESHLNYCISADEAIKVLTGAIYLKIPVQVISTTDFKKQLAKRVSGKGDEFLNLDVAGLTEKTDRPELSTAYEIPATEMEERVKSLLETFFGMENIGVNDNFFELGGDSLKAMVLIKRIKKDFNTEITLKEFFTIPTIRGIADHIDNITWLNTDAVTVNEIVL